MPDIPSWVWVFVTIGAVWLAWTWLASIVRDTDRSADERWQRRAQQLRDEEQERRRQQWEDEEAERQYWQRRHDEESQRDH